MPLAFCESFRTNTPRRRLPSAQSYRPLSLPMHNATQPLLDEAEWAAGNFEASSRATVQSLQWGLSSGHRCSSGGSSSAC